MLWTDKKSGRGAGEPDLRTQLLDRLRLLAEFATLGAYELTAPEGDAYATADRGRTVTMRAPVKRTQRVFLFSRVPVSVCRHGAPEQRPPCGSVSWSAGGRRERTRRERRGGAVSTPEQPCVWAASRSSASD